MARCYLSKLLAPERFTLSVWKGGQKSTLGGVDFWNLVNRYVGFIHSCPAVGPFGLIIGHSSADTLALFLAMAGTRRLVSFFPPNMAIQDKKHYSEQQSVSLKAINPSSLLVFDEKIATSLSTIDPELRDRSIPVPAFSEQGPFAKSPSLKGLALFVDALTAGQPLFVQHSSGTTGIKKAVAITGAALVQQFCAYWPEIRALVGEEVRVASWLPLYHDMGLLATFLLPVLGGDSISIVDPFEWIAQPVTLFDIIESNQCNVCWLPNFAFRHFTRLKRASRRANFDTVRAWIDCSEPCRYVDALLFEETFSAWGVPDKAVVGCYAMAETVFAVSQLRPDERRALAVPRNVLPGQDLKQLGAEVISEAPPTV